VLGLGTANKTQIQAAVPGYQYFKSTLHRSCCTHTTAVYSVFNLIMHSIAA